MDKNWHGESNMGTYITTYKRDSQWEFAVCLRELKQGLWMGREVQEGGDIGTPMAGSMLMFDRKQQNSVKQLSLN